MIKLSEIAVLEKNKLASDTPWITLFRIKIPEVSETIRICRNNTNVLHAGRTWYAFPVSVGEIEEEKNETATEVSLQVYNLSGALDTYMEQYNGFIGSTVDIILVFMKDSTTYPATTVRYTVTESNDKNGVINLVLSGFNPHNTRFPRTNLKKTVCRYKQFKGPRCGYSGSQTVCDRSYNTCFKLDNAARFGGCLTLGSGGIYV